ncbi:hypothetical protein CRG98_016726 [Punica granatum]|uniref:Uncharacterized protein n=2 Tax=Punica granatum TaxID=22663 RepID=A0A2I0K2W9_PUNGR|nr:hypothetical protein CRG98_016726 [Punica granatum]
MSLQCSGVKAIVMEEDKRLDFNQPFLSVRRFSPAVPPPEAKDKSRKTKRTLPKVPQPPPYRSELKSGPLRNPGTVPFTWEKSPGRPKCEGKSLNHTQQKLPGAPKLPPGRTPDPKQDESSKASSDCAKDIRCWDHVLADNIVAKQERPDQSTELGTTSAVEDGEETYYDAPDNLSRTESFFYNCSISGLSGLDGSDLRSSGRFATDPQVQDFMMGRFLPAAKAVASETPAHSYAQKKQPQPPVAREQPRLRVKKASDVNKQHPLYQFNPSFLSRVTGQISGFESEEDDDTEPESSTLKVCGLLPRFLLKSSFCISDAGPDMGVRNVEKRNGKSKTSRTNQSTHQRDSRNVEVSAKNQHLLEHGNLPGEIGSSIPHSSFQEEKGAQEKGCTSFRDLLANDGDEWKSSSGSRGPMVERTLYIDSLRTINSRSSDTSSVSGPPSYRGIDFDVNAVNGSMRQTASVESLPWDIKEINVVDEKEISEEKATEPVDSVSLFSLPNGRSDKMEQAALFGSSHHEIKHIVVVDEKEILGRKSIESIELNFPEPDKFIAQGTTPENSSTCPADEKIDTEQQSTTRSSNHGNNSRPARSTFHIPPLLPKSPAESWLFRTLPSVSYRYSPARFFPSPEETNRFQSALKPLPTDPKWEKIIKTTRPSSEMLTPIPEI